MKAVSPTDANMTGQCAINDGIVCEDSDTSCMTGSACVNDNTSGFVCKKKACVSAASAGTGVNCVETTSSECKIEAIGCMCGDIVGFEG